MSWSDDAWRRVAGTYTAVLDHPFVKELRSGELDQDVFLRYLLDDARYLEGYSRALALLAGRLPTTSDLATMARAAAGAVDAERLLHERFLADRGIDANAAGEATPTCQLYVSALIAAAAVEPVEVAMAAVLPCFRVYAEVGAAIEESAVGKRTDPLRHPYAAWIATYADPEFAAIVRDVEAITDRLAENAGDGVLDRMFAAYERSTQLEWMFWDAAWRAETWPAQVA